MHQNRFLAPTIGGILAAYLGTSSTYIVVGILFLLSTISLFYLKEPMLKQQEQKIPWLKQVLIGYRYFFKQKQLIWLGFFTSLVQFSVEVTMVINVPYVLEELKGT
ncbi:MFS transporter [Priestia megaterium]|uniref:MFS transporter n=1 Tax=Priestia megaterium TaxID=1404 RepID=UPI00207A0E1E|nr:MFS transporter [Priestia megaterium]USL45561.1 hypothetical protein LIS78_29640 [Priestia megaterium]